MSDYRTERDSMGELKVPAKALYGAQTQRAVDNFPISGLAMPREFIRALGLIKSAAAQANADLGYLPKTKAKAIRKAAERVAAATEATRQLGFPFLLTARADGFLHGHTNLDDAIRRLQAYEKAGADVLMAPGLPDLMSVKAVCAEISKPFNFMVGIPGKSFCVPELEAVGVRRISLASSL